MIDTIQRYLLFIIGLFFSALGVAITKKGELGVSPISSVANVLSIRLPQLSLGYWLIIWNCVLILGQILLLRRKFQWLQLLQVPLSFLFGWFTDFGVWLISFFTPKHYVVQILLVLAGTVVLGFGITLAVIANVILNSGEAFVKALSDTIHKEFGNVNAVPICLDTQDTEEIIKTVTYLAPGFGGINLEDISAPRCFEIEERLKEILDIPVFHDDQHGTAIVVLAGVINALKVVGKKKEDCRVVVNGAGSAGVAITKLLLTYGFPNIIMCDKVGIVSKDTEGLNWMQKKMTEVTNLNNETGSLADALKGADIFIGVSAPNIVTPKMVASMNRDSILFAMANPIPEIMPDVAKAAGARVVGTGRSDFPNQVNNVVAFPGIFKGALEGRATQITEEMKLAAAEAIAGLVPADKLSDDNIMPEAFDPQVAEVVANAVKSHIR